MLWFAGLAIRVPILVVPPILPFIRADLNMSGTEIGVLSGIPMILLALAAVPGSAMVSKLGALRAVLVGILIAAIGGALRGLAFTTAVLFVTTAIASAGIAITQPAMPAIVKEWLPSRIGFGTAVYSNGLVAGCIFPVAITLSLIMPSIGNNWRLDLVLWSLPVFATFLYLLIGAPKTVAGPESTLQLTGFFSKFDFSLIWKIGLIFGANNCVFFGTNAFLPPYLVQTGHADLVTAALTAYNITQLPGSFLVVALAHWMERRHWPYVCAGFGLVLGIAWLASSSGTWTIAAAMTLGLFSGVTLATGLMLPPLLSRPGDVARTAAGMFTLSYTLAMLGSVMGGAAWDLFGHPRFAFWVLAVCALPLIVITPAISFRQASFSIN